MQNKGRYMKKYFNRDSYPLFFIMSHEDKHCFLPCGRKPNLGDQNFYRTDLKTFLDQHRKDFSEIYLSEKKAREKIERYLFNSIYFNLVHYMSDRNYLSNSINMFYTPYYHRQTYSYDFIIQNKDNILFLNKEIKDEENKDNAYCFFYMLNYFLFLKNFFEDEKNEKTAYSDDFFKYLKNTSVIKYNINPSENKITFAETGLESYLSRMEEFFKKYGLYPDRIIYDDNVRLDVFATKNKNFENNLLLQNFARFFPHYPYYFYRLAFLWNNLHRKKNKVFVYNISNYGWSNDDFENNINNTVDLIFNNIRGHKKHTLLKGKSNRLMNIKHRSYAIFYDDDEENEIENLFKIIGHDLEKKFKNTMEQVNEYGISVNNQYWHVFLDTTILQDYMKIFDVGENDDN